MRVDEQAGPDLTGQAEPSRLVERLLFAGAALLVVLAGYFLATTCWEGRWYRGCRGQGAGDGIQLILLAQIVGFTGFVKMRRVSRRTQDHTSRQSLETDELRPAVMNHFWFWPTLATAVVLVGAGIATFLWSLLLLGFSCWPSPNCVAQEVLFAVAFLALGEALGFAGFLVARRAFRRRPWRHNNPLEPST